MFCCVFELLNKSQFVITIVTLTKKNMFACYFQYICGGMKSNKIGEKRKIKTNTVDEEIYFF